MSEILGSVEQTVGDEYSSFVKREPVVLAHLIGGPLAGVGSYLVTHGVITGTQASQATQWSVTVIVTLAIALQGFLLRRYVAPAWKAAAPELGQLAGELGSVGFEGEAGLPSNPLAPLPSLDELGAAPAELSAPSSKPDLPPAPITGGPS